MSISFKEASKRVQQSLSVAEITSRWNAEEDLHKRLAKETTIVRWLRPGPKTKNPNFEPWIIELSEKLANDTALDILDHIAHRRRVMTYMVTFLGFAAENDLIDSRRDRATAASLAAFYRYDRDLSDQQKQLIHRLYGRVKTPAIESGFCALNPEIAQSIVQ